MSKIFIIGGSLGKSELARALAGYAAKTNATLVTVPHDENMEPVERRGMSGTLEIDAVFHEGASPGKIELSQVLAEKAAEIHAALVVGSEEEQTAYASSGGVFHFGEKALNGLSPNFYIHEDKRSTTDQIARFLVGIAAETPTILVTSEGSRTVESDPASDFWLSEKRMHAMILRSNENRDSTYFITSDTGFVGVDPGSKDMEGIVVGRIDDGGIIDAVRATEKLLAQEDAYRTPLQKYIFLEIDGDEVRHRMNMLLPTRDLSRDPRPKKEKHHGQQHIRKLVKRKGGRY